MKDQAHYNITPDQGWSKLRPALDEVLPVNRPARRFAFLWWSTSALLMSGVLGLFVFKGVDFFTQPISTEMPSLDSKQKDGSTPINTVNELKANESAVIPASSVPVTNETGLKNQTAKNKVEINKSETIKAVIPVSKSKKPIKAEPIASANTHQENILDVAGLESQVSESSEYSIVPSTSSETKVTESSITPSAIQEPSIRNAQIIKSIPVLYATGLETNELPGNLITPVKASNVKTSTPLIEPTIAASGLIGLNGGVGGSVSAGVDVNVSRRFSITTGVGYMGYRPDASFFGGAQDLASNAEYNAILNYDPIYANEGINTYVDGTSFNSAAGYNAINPLVENLHQWQVSGGVKWKMSPRFYVDGGVTFGFGTTAYSAYPIVSGDPQSIGTGLKIGNTLNSYDVIRSTMTSVYGGVGYNVGKHFDVFAQWTHGLDSYILSEPGSPSADLDGGSRTDYIRGLNLGLKYTL